MAEYIEREAALEMLNKSLSFCENELDLGAYRTGCISATRDDIGNIKHIPAADVVEVRHGEWISAEGTSKGQKFICSICKGVSYYPQPTRDKKWVKHCGYSHCPHCLAKMDGKGEGE